MDCKYFKRSKLIKRIMGIDGYCTIHKFEISLCNKIHYYPYVYCKDKDGKIIENCAREIIFDIKYHK